MDTTIVKPPSLPRSVSRRDGWLLVLPLAAGLLFILDIALGPVRIHFLDVLQAALGFDGATSPEASIVTRIRLPKAATALLAGSALSVAGLLMQTLFRNPLAGPEVLGITSGASLGVALVMLSSGLAPNLQAVHRADILGGWILVAAASLGSALVLLLVLAVSARVRDNTSLMIIGLMLGTLSVSLVSLMLYLSAPEQIQDYLMWTFGSLGGVTGAHLLTLSVVVAAGLLLALAASKPLNLLLLGETQARSLGLSVPVSRAVLLAATSLLAGSVTAFCGPIAFIGLAVPHLCRGLLRASDHLRLILASACLGSLVLLLCDIVSQLPGSRFLMPLNVLTALVGAPVVIAVVIRARHRRNFF
ncbi:MAG TPA: iron ABC transporter permease [Fibrobacteria bacterium]|nr:iron ABC transporter permease [Fibrobacteria bacterium]